MNTFGMRTRDIFRILGTLLIGFLAMSGITACGDNDDNGKGDDSGSGGGTPTALTINVTTAGTLKDRITEAQVTSVKRLTLTGKLNGTDFKLLRRMAGLAETGTTTGQLQYLNFEGASIVAGGDSYGVDTIGTPLSTKDNVVGAFLFTESPTLQEVRLSSTATEIGAYAFYKCEVLENTTIGKRTKTIGECAYDGCYNLNAVNIYDLKAWCGILFQSNPLGNAHNLSINGVAQTTLTIPDGVETISASAFYGCNAQAITFPSSLKTIGEAAFERCSGLTSLEIPEGVEKIGAEAFAFSSLKSITLPSSLRNIGNTAFYNSALRSITLPSGITDMGTNVFERCESLTEATLPDGLETLPQYTFNSCSNLQTVHLGSNIRKIGKYAFLYCNNLTRLELNTTVPPTCEESELHLSRTNCYIAVPASALNSYKMYTPWKLYNLISL